MFSHRLPANLTTNRLTDAVRAARQSGRLLIDLTETNPTRTGIDYPAGLLASLADPRGLTYSPSPFGLPDARAAVARDYERFAARVTPDRVVLTASTSDAYSLLFKLLANAGDEVLVPRPSYPLFDHLTQLDLVTARTYDLEYHGRWSIDLNGLQSGITDRTRAILLVSPNNPTGSWVSAEELDHVATLCASRGIAVIVDEVFADYELERGVAATARATAITSGLAFALGGLSKSIGLPQVKLGWIVVGGGSAEQTEALRRLELICDTYLSVSTPVQLAAAELLRQGAAVRLRIRERVQANYRTLQARAGATPSCGVLRTDGGWSAVLRVPTFESEEALVLRLLDAGVLVHPGYFFDFPRESFLVVSLLPAPDLFAEGIARVLRHFDCTTSAGTHV